ncbi:hypothetical protein ACFPRL_27805 [Pseudoclavibacter helvolus]
MAKPPSGTKIASSTSIGLSGYLPSPSATTASTRAMPARLSVTTTVRRRRCSRATRAGPSGLACPELRTSRCVLSCAVTARSPSCDARARRGLGRR